MHISCPVWVMQATVFLVQCDDKKHRISGAFLCICNNFVYNKEKVAQNAGFVYNIKAVLSGELAVPCTRNPL